MALDEMTETLFVNIACWFRKAWTVQTCLSPAKKPQDVVFSTSTRDIDKTRATTKPQKFLTRGEFFGAMDGLRNKTFVFYRSQSFLTNMTYQKLTSDCLCLKIFFFCLRSLYWRSHFSTPEILLYFSLQHPLHTRMVTHPSANHGQSCFTSCSDLTGIAVSNLVLP